MIEQHVAKRDIPRVDSSNTWTACLRVTTITCIASAGAHTVLQLLVRGLRQTMPHLLICTTARLMKEEIQSLCDLSGVFEAAPSSGSQLEAQ